MSRNVCCTVRSDILSLCVLTLWNTIILSFQYKYQAAVYILEWATPSLMVWLWCYCYEVIVIEYELDSLIIDFNTSSTGMVWVPVKMARSAAKHQGNVREFHGVWRVVTLLILYFIAAGMLWRCSDRCEHPLTDARLLGLCGRCDGVWSGSWYSAGFPHILESPGFFPGFFRSWKVVENQFGPGKSWKRKLKVLESAGKWR